MRNAAAVVLEGGSAKGAGSIGPGPAHSQLSPAFPAIKPTDAGLVDRASAHIAPVLLVCFSIEFRAFLNFFQLENLSIRFTVSWATLANYLDINNLNEISETSSNEVLKTSSNEITL